MRSAVTTDFLANKRQWPAEISAASRLRSIPRIIPLATILLLVALLYRATPRHFFYFDDFTFLAVPLPTSLTEWIAALSPLHSNADGWYRPLTTTYYFGLYRTVFGFNPVPYMVTNLLMLLANVTLVFLLIKQLTQQQSIGAIAAYLYGISFIHFEPTSWALGFLEEALAFFVMIALLLYGLWQENADDGVRHWWYRWGSVIAFVLALASKETAVVVPLWLTMHFAARQIGRRPWQILARRLLAIQWPYYLICLLYLSFRSRAMLTRATGADEYTTYAVRGPATLVTHYFWYIRWTLNDFLYPLQAAKQIIAPQIHLGAFVLPSVGLFALVVFAAIVGYSRSSRRATMHADRDIRNVLLGIGWFVTGLLPVAMGSGQAAYYLVTPAIGAYLAAACILYRLFTVTTARSLMVGICVALVLWVGITRGAFQQIDNLEATSIPALSSTIRQTLETMKAQYPTLPANAEVVLVGYPARTWPNTSAERAIRSYYAGQPIRVFVKETGSAASVGNGSVYILRYDDGQIEITGPDATR